MSNLPANKPRLRAHFRELRAALPRTRRQAWAAELNRHLLDAQAVRDAGVVAGYLAFDGEPDIRFSLTQLYRRGATVGLPVLPEPGGERLGFRSWIPATPLRANRHGISEPRDTPEIALTDMDLLFIPLVAFDRAGGRLGMGAGWYDRTLAGHATKPLLVGVGWSLQELPEVPVDEWDIPLDAVVTEQGWFTCPG